MTSNRSHCSSLARLHLHPSCGAGSAADAPHTHTRSLAPTLTLGSCRLLRRSSLDVSGTSVSPSRCQDTRVSDQDCDSSLAGKRLIKSQGKAGKRAACERMLQCLQHTLSRGKVHRLPLPSLTHFRSAAAPDGVGSRLATIGDHRQKIEWSGSGVRAVAWEEEGFGSKTPDARCTDTHTTAGETNGAAASLLSSLLFSFPFHRLSSKC